MAIKKTMTIPALLLAMATYAFAQEIKVPDAVAALEALESAAQIAPKNADVTWNTGVYSYDEAGNITAIGPQYFVYDTVGRLIKARVARDFAGADTVTQTFSYDIYGNLFQTAKDAGAPQSIAVSAASNRLTALGTGYDEAGNQTGWSVGAISYVMSYDAFGMPASLDASNAPIRAFVYTADDERLFTYDGGSSPESRWTLRDLDGSVLRDYHLAGTTWTVSRDYYYRDGLMLASSNATTELHYSLDHLGTPRVLTNASRQQIAFQSFLPFGEELTPTPLDDGAVKKFTGHERDSDPAGIAEPLDYMHARFYNGRVGRFLSVDPGKDWDMSRPQSWNMCSYVRNNPMNRVDPNGREMKFSDYAGGIWEGVKQTASDVGFIIAKPALRVMAGFLNDSPRQVLQGSAELIVVAAAPTVAKAAGGAISGAMERRGAQTAAIEAVETATAELQSLPGSKRPATIIGGSQPSTGEVVVGRSTPGPEGCCAEADAAANLAVIPRRFSFLSRYALELAKQFLFARPVRENSILVSSQKEHQWSELRL